MFHLSLNKGVYTECQSTFSSLIGLLMTHNTVYKIDIVVDLKIHKRQIVTSQFTKPI